MIGWRCWLVLWLAAIGIPNESRHIVVAEQVFQLRNGLTLRGLVLEIATLKDGFGAASTNDSNIRPIWLIDDGLRRTYIHGKSMSQGEPIDVADPTQVIELWQPKPLGGSAVGGLGTIIGVSPFNEFGRRQLTMRGPDGPVNVIQGITELNSRYARLIALKGKPSLLWDMRVSTASIDSQTLDRIFSRRIDPENLDGKLETVRFYKDTQRYDDAKRALADIKNFPADVDREAMMIALTEQQAAQLLGEAKLRAEAGQYRLASGILSQFPLQDVGRITRIQVQDAIETIDGQRGQAAKLVDQLRTHVASLVPAQSDPLVDIVNEIATELSPDTLSRLSDYSRLGESENVALDDRVALAIAGWMLGSGSGEQNLSIATALIKIRELVAEYLACDDANRRAAIIETLRTLEGAQPEYIDRMLNLLPPPLDWPDGSAVDGVDGFYSVATDAAVYAIQLPPEYNPLRSYPAIVTLHNAGGYAEDQIDYWAGQLSSGQLISNPPDTDQPDTDQPDADQPGTDQPGTDQPSATLRTRMGHAARNGFIVVAPVWSRASQRSYEYTPIEHARVMASLRDAMRRASIDSDRVFITGHGEGGSAAWDIALAHPDLWAGMIAINATPTKTVHHFETNARYMPMYLLMGELDGQRADGSIMNDYMSFNHQAMVVMYRGRGREPFFDEIPRMFEWMKSPANVRRPIPEEIDLALMRDGDQFYWWLELGPLKPDVRIDPVLWDQTSRIRSGKVSASIGADNQIRVRGPSDQFRVLLRPQPGIDLAKEIIIRLGTRSHRFSYDGSIATMLEDARRRADRKRAFWFEATVP